MHHQSDLDLVGCMHNADAGLYWAQIATTQYAAADDPWNIQKLFTALDGAWLHHEKLTQAQKAVHRPRSTANDISVALWNRQSM